MRSPPLWSDEELQVERDLAEKQFITLRQNEEPLAYYAVWEEIEPQVRAAMRATDAARRIEGADFAKNKTLWQTLRYICAPRISEEDLWTLVGKKFKSVPLESAEQTARVLSSLVDMKRFPWVIGQREATLREMEAAVMSMVTLLTHERLSTNRRSISSKGQESQVSDALLAAGWTLDESRKTILALDQLPCGHFSRERKFGGAKCDVPVRLQDGRLLALECKVSSGPKNSWKRLQREIGGKANLWRGAFEDQVLTGAVLAGVFDLRAHPETSARTDELVGCMV